MEAKPAAANPIVVFVANCSKVKSHCLLSLNSEGNLTLLSSELVIASDREGQWKGNQYQSTASPLAHCVAQIALTSLQTPNLN